MTERDIFFRILAAAVGTRHAQPVRRFVTFSMSLFTDVFHTSQPPTRTQTCNLCAGGQNLNPTEVHVVGHCRVRVRVHFAFCCRILALCVCRREWTLNRKKQLKNSNCGKNKVAGLFFGDCQWTAS